ncbi:20 kDa chaperonin, chloroplastic-like protein [Tanacetum coccineum]
MSIYVNEVNVVNQNEPPSFEKVVGQLMRKRFVGKALVDPYTVQPPTTAPSAFLKVDRKRLKRKVRMLRKQNRRISFDDDVGLSRAPYSRRTKVKLPECLDMVYALGDDTSHIFPWVNNDIFVYQSFWLNLLGLKEGGWLSDRHLDAWFKLMWSFRPTDADWAIASSYFCRFVMRGDILGWVCNGVRCSACTNYKYTSLKPLGDRVLTKIKAAEEKSIGGILLPSTSQTKLQGGEVVVVVGEGRTIGDKKIDIGVKVEEAEETTAGGLLLPQASKEIPSIGMVIAVGPAPLNEEGVRTMDSISSKK